MKALGVALMLLCAPALVAAQGLLPQPADPAAGARLFRTRGCVECHAGDLARFQEQPRSLYALASAMWNHFPRMAERIRVSKTGRPYFTSSEMRDLVAFLYAGDGGRPLPTAPRLLGQPGVATRGERLVQAKGCLVCHSTSPSPGARARSLDDLKGDESPWSIVAQMWNHAFLMELDAQEQDTAWVPLSADDMADLVAYLERLMRARSRR